MRAESISPVNDQPRTERQTSGAAAVQFPTCPEQISNGLCLGHLRRRVVGFARRGGVANRDGTAAA